MFSRFGRVLCVALLLIAEAAAQPVYPPRSVRIIVGFPPGGSTDIIARMLAPGLSEHFGQQFVVDNRPGAAGSIAAEIVARSQPDGTTLLAVSAAFASNASLYSRLPYDSLRDFSPIARVAVVHNVLVAHPSVPARTVGELVALVKQRPGKLVFTSAGNGTVSHLALEMLRISSGGLNLLHVPHRGMAPAVLDVLAGEADALLATTPSTVTLIRSGRLRALGVASPVRAPSLPEVPTFAESGYRGFEAATWNGIVAPAGTPYDVITRLNLAIVQVAGSGMVRARLAAQGADVVGDTPGEFAAYLRRETEKWAAVVKASGARID